MKIDIGGSETIAAAPEILWKALNDPDVLTRCIPGCKAMIETGPDAYKVEMQLKVAAVGGSFEGAIALNEKVAPASCRIRVSGSGTLGHGEGDAHFAISSEDGRTSLLTYKGEGEVGGLVAGVGQRILGSVSKHLIGRFFVALRKELESSASA
jgi:hypothetical protein